MITITISYYVETKNPNLYVDLLIASFVMSTKDSIRNSRPPRLHYPRGSFSEVTDIHQEQLGVSLAHTFVSGFHTFKNPVNRSFALTLYVRFLTGLRSTLSTHDALSWAYRPSRAAHQSVSPESRLVMQSWKSSVTLLPI